MRLPGRWRLRLTCCRQKHADGNFAARNGARFHQIVAGPSATSIDFAFRGPLNAKTGEIMSFKFALVDATVGPRELAQAAVIAVHEFALVAIAVTSRFTAAMKPPMTPLTVGRLGAVRAILCAVSVRLEIRVELADVVSAVGHQQRSLGIRGAGCISDTRRQRRQSEIELK